MLKMLSCLHVNIFSQLIVLLENKGITILLALTHSKHQFSLDGFSNYVAALALDFDTPVF
jgi:hypothetical protein